MSADWVIRPFDEASDAGLRARIASRLNPGRTVSPRDPDILERFFTGYGAGAIEPGGETTVAAGPDGVAVGLIVLHSEPDPFTGHLRAYVDFLGVDEAAEGRGAGRALMDHAEVWAREHGCREVCLDVWGSNTAAIGFYKRLGYAVDHLRMARPLPEHAISPACEKTHNRGTLSTGTRQV